MISDLIQAGNYVVLDKYEQHSFAIIKPKNNHFLDTLRELFLPVSGFLQPNIDIQKSFYAILHKPT